jgi:hypothetical protein
MADLRIGKWQRQLSVDAVKVAALQREIARTFAVAHDDERRALRGGTFRQRFQHRVGRRDGGHHHRAILER